MYKQKNTVPIISEAAILIENKIVFSASNFNLIFSMKLDDFSLEILGSFPEEEADTKDLCGNIQYWDKKLIFIPNRAKKVWILNLVTNEWKGIKIERKDIPYKFYEACIYHDNLFLFGFLYPSIVRINLRDYQVSYLNDSIDKNDFRYGMFFTNTVTVEKWVYLACCSSNQVLKFNMSTMEMEWIKVGNENNSYSSIAWDGKKFWLAPRRNSAIVRWDGMFTYKEYDLPEVMKHQSYSFMGVICDEEKVFFPTIQNGYSLCIDKDENMSIVEKNRRCSLARKWGDVVVFMFGEAEINLKWRGKWKKCVCEIEIEKLQTYYEHFLDGAYIQFDEIEGYNYSLKTFLGMLYVKEKEIKSASIVGAKIWEEVKV